LRRKVRGREIDGIGGDWGPDPFGKPWPACGPRPRRIATPRGARSVKRRLAGKTRVGFDARGEGEDRHG
jgi:hypothetical protein